MGISAAFSVHREPVYFLSNNSSLPSSATPILVLPLHPRHTNPQRRNSNQQRQDNRLQRLNPLSLSNSAHDEREDGTARAAECGPEADGADVQRAREQLRHEDDGCGEHGAEHEAEEGDGYC